MKINKKYLALGMLGAVCLSSAAYATTTSVTATLAFETAISLTVNHNINFGQVVAGAGVYVMDTAGAITPSGGGVLIGGTTQVGQVTIVGDTTATIQINTSGYTTDHNVTLSAATCKYNGGSETACDTPLTAQTGPGAGKVLLLGVTATATSGTAAGDVATPAFNVNVIYG